MMRGGSSLSVPGTDERKVRKAWASSADEIVLDLEDAVPEAAKADARDAVARLLRRVGDPPKARLAVRVNAVGTPWCHLDIAMCAAGGLPRTMVVPKVESPGDLAFVDRLLEGAEAAEGRDEPVLVHALIETAAGLAAVREIAGASPRLTGLILGYADLAASLGRSPGSSWDWAQNAIVVAAKAYGLAAIDGPYLGVADDDSFAASVRTARDLGFSGKWVIHPQQLATVNAMFAPTEEEIAWALAVLEAQRTAEADGRGAVELDGQMVDLAVVRGARQTLSRADIT
jgi:citrate lyase subunit beta/citryl-CoA lyase